jgi:hypothetical protein
LRHRRPFRFLTALLAAAFLLNACSPSAEPNPPVVILATPSGEIELVEIFATHNPTLLTSGTPAPNVFPAGVQKIYLGIKFRTLSNAAERYNLNYELSYKGLKLETEFDSQPTSWKEQNTGLEVVILPLRRADGAAFGDGQYQAKLLVNGQLVALLNFAIGGATPTP